MREIIISEENRGAEITATGARSTGPTRAARSTTDRARATGARARATGPTGRGGEVDGGEVDEVDDGRARAAKGDGRRGR